MRNLLKMGLQRNVGGQDTIAGISCPPLPTTTAYTLVLVWISSSYVHANKVNGIHNKVLKICQNSGGYGKVDKIPQLVYYVCPTRGVGHIVFGVDPICISVGFSFGNSVSIGKACLKHYIS